MFSCCIVEFSLTGIPLYTLDTEREGECIIRLQVRLLSGNASRVCIYQSMRNYSMKQEVNWLHYHGNQPIFVIEITIMGEHVTICSNIHPVYFKS